MANRTEIDDYFVFKCERGLQAKGLADRSNYVKRLQFEMDIIIRMGFPGYFLIVQDFINWAKSQGIYVGPGRGSAAGSLVSYSLGITNLDPIKWNLLFERFLNPDRLGTPDYNSVFPLVTDVIDDADLTTDQVLDILESGGLEDARLQDIKNLSGVQ